MHKIVCACSRNQNQRRKLLKDSQGNGWFATDSQGHIGTLDGNTKTGTFHQTWVTAGDTACSVKEVLMFKQVASSTETKTYEWINREGHICYGLTFCDSQSFTPNMIQVSVVN